MHLNEKKIGNWSWNNGSVIKNTSCFSKGPRFNMVAYNYLWLQSQVIWCPFLALENTDCMHTAYRHGHCAIRRQSMYPYKLKAKAHTQSWESWSEPCFPMSYLWTIRWAPLSHDVGYGKGCGNVLHGVACLWSWHLGRADWRGLWGQPGVEGKTFS